MALPWSLFKWCTYSDSEQLTLMVLPSDDAVLINELFHEHIVLNIGHVINDVGSHVPSHYIGPSFNHDQLENPSEVIQPVVPNQLVDGDHITRTFAAQHRGMSFNSKFLLLHTAQLYDYLIALFMQALSDAGLFNWMLLGNVMSVRFFSNANTQTLWPFCGWHEEMYGEFITNIYDSLLHLGVTNFEYHKYQYYWTLLKVQNGFILPTSGKISIKVKDKNAAVKVIKAHSTLTDPNFMEALQWMVSSQAPTQPLG